MTMDVHEKFLEVITYNFDFHKKMAINLEALRAMAAKMATYGIAISDVQLMLVVFTNINSSMAHEYGCGFRPAMAAIRKLFRYKHVHTMNSLKTFTKELGSADGVCDMKSATSPSNLHGSNSIANAVDDRITRTQEMMQSYANSEYSNSEYESIYGNTSSSDSDSSGEIRKRQEGKARKKKKEDKQRREATSLCTILERGPPPGRGVKMPPNYCRH